jgi:hypothetical protein
LLHALDPVAAYMPVEQRVQVAAAGVEAYLPTAQLEHALADPAEYFPAEHDEEATVPAAAQ